MLKKSSTSPVEFISIDNIERSCMILTFVFVACLKIIFSKWLTAFVDTAQLHQLSISNEFHSE